jgi:hypothetical protein
MDDLGAIAALPALGHLRDRQRTPHKTSGRAMVSAMAIRPMARCKRALKNPLQPFQISGEIRTCREQQRHSRIDLIPR